MWIIVTIIVLIAGSMLIELSKDNSDLQNQSIAEKFEYTISALNSAAYNGNGSVGQLRKRSCSLYEKDSNQILLFSYSAGTLTITWKYKYFQKEVILEKDYINSRNLSIFEQQNIVEDMKNNMAIMIENHKLNVTRELF